MIAGLAEQPTGIGGSWRRNERRLLRPLLRIATASLWRGLGRPIDRRYGIDTEEARWPGEMRVASANAALGYEYSASPARSFWLSAGSLDIDASRFSFVDIGAGKGRAMLLAAQMRFLRVEGVEFASDLSAIAARNLEIAYPSPKDRARFTIKTMDAADYVLPDGPCVVYLYNPFGAELVERIAENLLASYRAAPRDIYVVYVNPLHREAFDRRPYHTLADTWYARRLDRSVPYGFALYRLHGSEAQAASAT